MRRTLLSLVALGPLLMAGCAITGKWSLATVEPEAARRDFDFGSLTLQKDGSFYAESQKPGIRTTSGTYTFKDRTLALMPHEGPRLIYNAVLPDANHLRLEKLYDGKKVRTEFTRVE